MEEKYEERQPGAYVINEKGEIVPDSNDEAMAERYSLKKKQNKKEKEKEEEVKDVRK
ncbi:MAG: hypothetical protein DDT19_02629 [Syntrophomonadaceae bacterium]|nr:hypothetical protein [Bacillota bacterium]